MYFLAVILPPVAVLLTGKSVQALLNLLLTILGWVPGAIHAILVVKDKKDDNRMVKQAKLIAKANKELPRPPLDFSFNLNQKGISS